jgi:hypothetical protein
MGNWLFSWLWKIVDKNDDFELWFCLNGEFVLEIRKEQWVFCWNSGLEVEDDENSIWSLNLWKLQFSPQTLENLQIGPWSMFRDSEQNKRWIMGRIPVYLWNFNTFNLVLQFDKKYNLTLKIWKNSRMVPGA